MDEDRELVAFLEARYGEDETAALAWPEDQREWKHVGERRPSFSNGRYEFVAAIDVSGRPADWWEGIWVLRDTDGSRSAHVALHDPARALREIDAKRRRLEMYSRAVHAYRIGPVDEKNSLAGFRDACWGALLADASIYAHHAGYQERWKL